MENILHPYPSIKSAKEFIYFVNQHKELATAGQIDLQNEEGVMIFIHDLYAKVQEQSDQEQSREQ
jgi:hypothetical protein